MSSIIQHRATTDDLYQVEGKAELIKGRIVRHMATGFRPNRVAGRIFRSLDDHGEPIGGYAFTDSMGFTVPELPSGRESFSPDASYYDGPPPANPMRFIAGPPKFAAEVRSEGDYQPSALLEMAKKRDDYFAAGTEVVWDVDPVAECVHVHRRGQAQPTTYQRGQMAEAEPAVPGWQVSVDWLFG